jgi:hypothetical protein
MMTARLGWPGWPKQQQQQEEHEEIDTKFPQQLLKIAIYSGFSHEK